MPGSCYVRAAYEFAHPEPGEICLAIGDVVEVTGAVDDNWLIGQNHSQSSQVGSFPKNFVEPIELPCVERGQKMFLAMRSFNGEMMEDLTFSRGDIIVGLSSVDANWWKGKVDDHLGIFPLTFVKELISISAEDTRMPQSNLLVESIPQIHSEKSNSTETASPVLTSITGKAKPVARAVATQDLDAQLDEELSFKKDDIIEVFHRVDDVFVLGQIGDKIGQFPLAFVEIFEGCLETPEVFNDNKKIKSKFDWWQDPNAEEVILRKSSLGEAEPTPSFEEQTAPISPEEEYILKTSHAFYSKPGSSSEMLLEGGQPEAYSLLDAELPGAHAEVAKDIQFVRTLFAFNPENDNELGFDAGELVMLIGLVDDQWMEGELRGKRGIFPGSYVELSDGHNMQHKYADRAIQPSGLEDEITDHMSNNFCSKLSSSIEVDKIDTVFHQTSVVSAALNGTSTQTSTDFQPVMKVEEKTVTAFTNVLSESSGQQDNVYSPLTEPMIENLSESSLCVDAELRLDEKNSPAELVATGQETVAVASDSVNSEAEELPSEENALTENPHESVVNVACSPFLEAAEQADATAVKSPVCEDEKLLKSALGKVLNELTSKLAYTESKSEGIDSNSQVLDVAEMQKLSIGKDLHENKQEEEVIARETALVDGAPTGEDMENSDMTNNSLVDSRRLKGNSDMSDFPAGHNQGQKLAKPTIKPKPKLKPKPERSPSVIKSVKLVDVPKKPGLKKGVSFCDDVIFFPVEPEIDSSTWKTEDSRYRFQGRTVDLESVQSSESSAKMERTEGAQKNGISSPTSPTTSCQITSGEVITVHFKKENFKASSLKPVWTSPSLSSKKQIPAEKESKKEAGGQKFGQSLFYNDVANISVAPSLTSPVPSKKLPPRPAKPKPNLTQGAIVLPNGIFYTSEFKESGTRPVPCRPAPPRPPSTPPATMSTPLTIAETDTVDHENVDVIKDILRRITEIEKDLENLKNEETALETQLAELTNEEEAELIRDNLEFCRANATGLTEELGQLKENLSHLRPFPWSTTDKRLQFNPDGSARSPAGTPKAARRQQEELRKKRLETRVKVIKEMIQTEHDYLQCLYLCLETFFNSDMPESKCPSSVDLETLFGNIYEVVELSQKFINLMEANTLGKPFEEQLVGICFEELQEELKRVYAIYCRNHDGVITLLEKYETMPEVEEYFTSLVNSMRIHATVFDIGSILIKPVQRIMKYPLLLQELLKTTDEDHPDHGHLVAAVAAMKNVATYVNEFKRRKDLVLKYKKPSDMSLRDMISRLTVHSYRKKLSRLSMMVVGTLTVDEDFSQQELRFNALEECVPALLQNISQYLDVLQKSLAAMELVANDTADYYGNNRSEYEIDQLCRVSNCLTHTMFSHFKSRVQSDVLPPLNSLVMMLQGPQQLIRKRYHKLLDYENARLKQKSVRDPDQVKPTNEEVQSCENDYKALNLQLLEDLPKFCEISVSVITDCLCQFALIQEGFLGAVQKELLKLLKGFSESSAGGIVESFNIAHTEAVDRLSDLSFIPKSFNPLVEEKRRQRSIDSAITSEVGNTQQTNDQRAMLCQTYSPDKLYTVGENFEGMQVMDLKLSRGVLVGVIKESDPMGNKDRFLVTNGLSRGFIPKRLLIPYTGSDDNPSMCSTGEVMMSPSSTCSSSSPIISDFVHHLNDESLDLSNDDQLFVSVTDDNDQQDKEPGVGSGEASATDSPTSALQIFYRAEYPYVAEGDLEVSLSEGELVKVLQHQDVQGNGEWWLVERKDGRHGYVPATYLCDASFQDSHA